MAVDREFSRDSFELFQADDFLLPHPSLVEGAVRRMDVGLFGVLFAVKGEKWGKWRSRAHCC